MDKTVISIFKKLVMKKKGKGCPSGMMKFDRRNNRTSKRKG